MVKDEQEGASLLTLVRDPYILVAAGAITFANLGNQSDTGANCARSSLRPFHSSQFCFVWQASQFLSLRCRCG